MILISILFLLISNAVTLRRDIAILFNRVAIIIILYSILHNITSFSMLNSSISLHGGLIYINNITQIFQIFILIITFLILNLTSFFPEVNLMYKKVKTYVHINLFSELGKGLTEYNKHIPYKKEITDNIIIGEVQDLEHLKIIEYPLILLFIITGSIFLISTNDLISIFLAIELQSYGLYLLSTINRNSELSTTGGLIYFLLGGLSSCFILLGTSLLYANSGTTNIDGFYIITSISENSNISDIYKPDYISFSLLIFSIGFLFKISAAPFHF
jgi:NADH-ubiquinone oxidoreductase chain 2